MIQGEFIFANPEAEGELDTDKCKTHSRFSAPGFHCDFTSEERWETTEETQRK